MPTLPSILVTTHFHSPSSLLVDSFTSIMYIPRPSSTIRTFSPASTRPSLLYHTTDFGQGGTTTANSFAYKKKKINQKIVHNFRHCGLNVVISISFEVIAFRKIHAKHFSSVGFVFSMIYHRYSHDYVNACGISNYSSNNNNNRQIISLGPHPRMLSFMMATKRHKRINWHTQTHKTFRFQNCSNRIIFIYSSL